MPSGVRAAFARLRPSRVSPLARDIAVMVGAFAVLRVVAVAGLPAERFPDTGTYFDLDFLGGATRLWTLPLFYGAVPGDAAKVATQVAVGVLCWSVLAVEAARCATNEFVARVGAALVLILGLTTQVTQWDRILLSESLAISLSAVTVALVLRTTRLRSRGGIIALGAALVLWGFTRHIDATFLSLSLPLAAAVIVAGLRRRGALLAALCLLLALWTGLCVARADSIWRANAFDIVVHRILPDAEATRYFERHGLEVTPVLRAEEVQFRGGTSPAFQDPRFQRWLEHSWRRTYSGYLLRDPLGSLTEPLARTPKLLSKDLDYADTRSVLPGPVQKGVSPTGAWVLPFFAFLVLAFWFATLVRRATAADAVFAGTVLTTVLTFIAVWQTSAIELPRHLAPWGVQLKIGLIGMTVLAADRALAGRRLPSLRAALGWAGAAGRVSVARARSLPLSAKGVVLLGLAAPVWETQLIGLPGGVLTVGRLALLVAAVMLVIELRRGPAWRGLWDGLPRLFLAGYLGLGLWILLSAGAHGCDSACHATAGGFFELLAATLLAFAATARAYWTRDWTLLAAAAGALLAAFAGLAGIGPIHTETAQFRDFGRIAGTLGNPNNLGALLAPGVVILLAYRRCGTRAARIAVAAACAVTGLVLLLTYSRGGLIAAVAGIVALALLEARSREARVRIVAAATALIVVAVAAYPLFRVARDNMAFGSLDRSFLERQFASGWGTDGVQTKLRQSGPREIRVAPGGPAQGAVYYWGRVTAGHLYELRFRARSRSDALIGFGLKDGEQTAGEPRAGTGAAARRPQAFRLAWRPRHDARFGVLSIWGVTGTESFSVSAVRLTDRGSAGAPPRVRGAPARLGQTLYRQQVRTRRREERRYLQSRWDAATISSHAFVTHPLTGLGWERFPTYASKRDRWGKLATHDEYLRVAAELGLVGLLLLAAMGAGLYRAARGGGRSPATLAAKGAVITAAVGLAFANVLVSPAASMPLALAMGVLVGSRRRH